MGVWDLSSAKRTKYVKKIEKASNGGCKMHRHNKIPDPSHTRHKVPPWQKVETEPKPISTKWSAKCLRETPCDAYTKRLKPRHQAAVQRMCACNICSLTLIQDEFKQCWQSALFLWQSKTSSVRISRRVSLQEKQGTKSINKCNTTTIIKWSRI